MLPLCFRNDCNPKLFWNMETWTKKSFASLWCVYLTANTVCQGLLLFWMRREFHVSFSGRDTMYIRKRLKSSLRKFYGRCGDLIKHYEVPLSQMLHDILGHDQIQWHPPLITHLTKSWPCYRTRHNCRFWRHYLILGSCHRTFATGAANQQRTLTPPDTWSCPIWDLHLL